MQLELKRELTSELGTEGTLRVNGAFQCYTLEPPEGFTDARGITAIPAGSYKVVLNYSPKFKRVMPQIVNVAGRMGIRIHWGNYEACTDGCVLVGESRGPDDEVWNSRAAFDLLYARLKLAFEHAQEIDIDILPASPAAQEV